MACGAVLVTSDNGGSQDYAIADLTALVEPPKEPGILADAFDRLIQDSILLCEFADRGHAFVQQFGVIGR